MAKKPRQRGAFYLRTRLFLAFFLNVVKHITTIVLALVGSAIFTVPTWVRPLLNPTGQRYIDAVSVLPAGSYPILAIAVLVGGFVLACFFAWEEEHEDAERWRTELELTGELLGEPTIEPWEIVKPPLNLTNISLLTCRVAVRNTGRAPTLARAWKLVIEGAPLFGRFESSIADPTDLEWLKNRPAPLGSMQEMPIRTSGPILVGDEWRATLRFTTMFTPDTLKAIPAWRIEFEDVRDGKYEIRYENPHSTRPIAPRTDLTPKPPSSTSSGWPDMA
jgi:hypothetical protein